MNDRASRYQVYMVPYTYEVELAQLEESLGTGAITKEEFQLLRSKLQLEYGGERHQSE